MQDKLFIYLHAHDLANPTWATGAYTHYGETESLLQIAADREVIVIVPAEDIVLITATLPKMPRAKLLQALPFALEEQLIADVADLHFAAGAYQVDGSLPVAIVAHEKMHQWLALLKSWNVNADVIIPLTFALPYDKDIWHVLLHEDMAVVRSQIFAGYGCDKHNFVELLELACATCEIKPSVIWLHNYTSHAYAKELNLSVEVKEELKNREHIVDDLVKSVVHAPALNLLQGVYAIKKNKFPKLKFGWKIAAYLTAAWVFLLFLYPSVSYLILKHKINSIDAEIAQIYQHNFPQAASVVAPKLRLQEKLQKLSSQIGENQSLIFVGFIGKGMLETPSIKLKRFDFQNNLLTLELTAATPDDFSAFADYLTRQGLTVKQQNANIASGRVSATLQIE